MSKRFTSRLVVITGAGGGLGRVSALAFAREGAELVLTDVMAQGLEETAALVRKEGGVCSTHCFDLGVESAIKEFGAQICARHPRIDVLFNNAGIAYGEVNQSIEAISLEKWLHFLTVNSLAPVILAQSLRPSLANAKGVILNQSSMASWQPGNVYGVTKATLNSLTYAMANVFGADGIRVNAIAPGIMETPANKAGLTAETYTRVQNMQLLKLHGTAEDIANLAVFLASDEGRFINCEIVGCDAGNRLRGWRY
jgi:3-oxoacyl-[acyl-carrier protein] reductase